MKYPIGTVFRYCSAAQTVQQNRIIISESEYQVSGSTTRYPLYYMDGEAIIIISLPKEYSFDKLYLTLKSS